MRSPVTGMVALFVAPGPGQPADRQRQSTEDAACTAAHQGQGPVSLIPARRFKPGGLLAYPICQSGCPIRIAP